jgi:hypothetical protein
MSTPPNNDLTVIKANEDFTLRDAVEHTWFKTRMRMYILSEDKLNDLTSGYDSLTLLFFGVCAGAAVSLGIACKETASDAARPYYFAAFTACFVVGLYLGIRGIIDYRKTQKKKAKLYAESTPLEFVPAKNNPMPPSQQ